MSELWIPNRRAEDIPVLKAPKWPPRRALQTKSLQFIPSATVYEPSTTFPVADTMKAGTPTASGFSDTAASTEGILTPRSDHVKVVLKDPEFSEQIADPEVWIQREVEESIRSLGHFEPTIPGLDNVGGAINPNCFRMANGSLVITIKCPTLVNILIAYREGFWAFSEKVTARVGQLFLEKTTSQPVIFIFSVSGSKEFCAVAAVDSFLDDCHLKCFVTEDGKQSPITYTSAFQVRFIYTKIVPFSVFRQVEDKHNGVSVTQMWNGMPFGDELGRDVLQAYVEAPHVDNILVNKSPSGRKSSRRTTARRQTPSRARASKKRVEDWMSEPGSRDSTTKSTASIGEVGTDYRTPGDGFVRLIPESNGSYAPPPAFVLGPSPSVSGLDKPSDVIDKATIPTDHQADSTEEVEDPYDSSGSSSIGSDMYRGQILDPSKGRLKSEMPEYILAYCIRHQTGSFRPATIAEVGEMENGSALPSPPSGCAPLSPSNDVDEHHTVSSIQDDISPLCASTCDDIHDQEPCQVESDGKVFAQTWVTIAQATAQGLSTNLSPRTAGWVLVKDGVDKDDVFGAPESVAETQTDSMDSTSDSQIDDTDDLELPSREGVGTSTLTQVISGISYVNPRLCSGCTRCAKDTTPKGLPRYKAFELARIAYYAACSFDDVDELRFQDARVAIKTYVSEGESTPENSPHRGGDPRTPAPSFLPFCRARSTSDLPVPNPPANTPDAKHTTVAEHLREDDTVDGYTLVEYDEDDGEDEGGVLLCYESLNCRN